MSVQSVQFSCSFMSDSLWPHELQHARPPCPLPTPGVHSNSRPSSRWCHPAISSSVVPFSSCQRKTNFIWLHEAPCSPCFPDGLDHKESACNAGDLGSIPGLGRFPREGHGYPIQYSCLENSMDRGAWA